MPVCVCVCVHPRPGASAAFQAVGGVHGKLPLQKHNLAVTPAAGRAHSSSIACGPHRMSGAPGILCCAPAALERAAYLLFTKQLAAGKGSIQQGLQLVPPQLGGQAVHRAGGACCTAPRGIHAVCICFTLVTALLGAHSPGGRKSGKHCALGTHAFGASKHLACMHACMHAAARHKLW